MSIKPRVDTGRLPALDQLRGFVIVLVVLHHAILAYCVFARLAPSRYDLSTAPIIDAHRWIGFDLVAVLNDAFFMPLLFLLSGLFVPSGLGGTPRSFVRKRLLRLGLPFLLAELTIVPLAYYPSFLQAAGTPGFDGFWVRAVTVGPTPSGPPWFLGVLLGLDIVAALVVPLVRGPTIRSPGRSFAVLLGGSVLVYLPMLLVFGPSRWVSIGPLAVQASRVLLYAAYFAAGVALGAEGLPGIRRFGGALAARWAGWAGLAVLSAAGFVALLLAHGSVALDGLGLALFCAAACFAVPALFLRFGGRPGPVWRSLAANSFAIYLLHYPAVTWIQYALLPIRAGAPVKGMVVFTGALAASWCGAVLLRQVPGVARVI